MTCIELRCGIVCVEVLESGYEPCPNVDLHTPSPAGYVAAGVWAEEMLLTHTQEKCPGCGLWVVWVPKETKADD
jgi:hypothetical protein